MDSKGTSNDPRSIPRAGSASVGAVVQDQQLLERVREALEDEVDVVEKRMFGSIGFMVGGVLRVGVGTHRDHVMMARVPLAEAESAVLEPGVKPAVMGGRTMRGWLFFDDAAVQTDDQLRRWVSAALAAEA
jgi:TfoX/Sxy family transcriptional regulator of competence genes